MSDRKYNTSRSHTFMYFRGVAIFFNSYFSVMKYEWNETWLYAPACVNSDATIVAVAFVPVVTVIACDGVKPLLALSSRSSRLEHFHRCHVNILRWRQHSTTAQTKLQWRQRNTTLRGDVTHFHSTVEGQANWETSSTKFRFWIRLSKSRRKSLLKVMSSISTCSSEGFEA